MKMAEAIREKEAVVVSDAVVEKDWFRAQVIQIYSAVNPSKLSAVDGFLKKYEGREQELCDNLCKKYAVDVFQSHDGQ